MTANVLVAYATKHGSTADIAEAIGGAIHDAGLDAVVHEASDVRDVSEFAGVVVGSAVYLNKWQGDAIEFLKRFERDLGARPTWLFSSGPTGGTPDADARVVELLARQPHAPADVARLGERIYTRGHVTFGGRTGPEMTGVLERWMPKGDWRDFDAIRTWATGIAHDVAETVDSVRCDVGPRL